MCIPILSLDLYGMDLPVNRLVARFEGPLGRIGRVAIVFGTNTDKVGSSEIDWFCKQWRYMEGG